MRNKLPLKWLFFTSIHPPFSRGQQSRSVGVSWARIFWRLYIWRVGSLEDTYELTCLLWARPRRNVHHLRSDDDEWRPATTESLVSVPPRATAPPAQPAGFNRRHPGPWCATSASNHGNFGKSRQGSLGVHLVLVDNIFTIIFLPLYD